MIEDDEECDDANLDNTDDCTNDCIGAECGDGFIHADLEECDAGEENGPGMPCTSQCLANVCGDGEIGPGEGCDDGNDIDGDDCTNTCALASCGDAIIGPGEECDDGNVDEDDACLSTCVDASCGDGFLYLGQEECDDGELNSDTAMCTAMCIIAVCGDGFVFDGVEACDDGNDDNGDVCTNSCTEPLDPPTLLLSFSQIKQFEFSWAPLPGAEFYRLLESADMGEPFMQVGGDVVGESLTLAMPLHFRLDASYKLLACNGDGCSESAIVDVVGTLAQAVGYFKASNTGGSDWFGDSIALSGDGNTLAVGAIQEDSSATGINGNPADNGTFRAGAVYVFVRNGLVWTQQAYVKASNTNVDDRFGDSVSLSDDGNTLVVGTGWEDSNATGVGGNQGSNSAVESGAAYVFVRNGQVWAQQAYIKASNTNANDFFGISVTLSGDGDTLAVGAYHEDSNATGINGNQGSNTAADSGAVYVFVRNGQVWTQQAYVKASNTGSGDEFGHRVALSDDGDTLAVGAYGEAFGAAYVFTRSGQVWTQRAYLKPSNGAGWFGFNLALSGDGDTLAVSAIMEDSAATGIDGDQDDVSAPQAGAVFVFVRNGLMWTQQAYVKASNTDTEDWFGYGVALSSDGDILAVSTDHEASSATGIGGNQADNSANHAGAVYVFVRDGLVWSQRAYVKAPNTRADDLFGYGVALSNDGDTLAVSAIGEDSNAMGIGGNQADNSAEAAGAVYLY